MTLLMIDGLEDNSSATTVIGSGASGFVAARNGLGYQMGGGSNNNYVAYSPFPSSTIYYCGVALRITTDIAAGPVRGLINFLGDSVGITQTEVFIETNGSITARRSWSDVLIPGAQSAPGLIQTNQWFYLEFKATCSGTATGRVTARINNTTVFDINNVATNATANATSAYGGVSFGGAGTTGGGAPGMVVDDVYFGIGDDPFLGDLVVETLYPNGDGAVNQWLGSDGNSVQNYLLVNEVGSPNTSNYVKDSVVGHQDLYALQDLSVVSSQVLALGHFATAQKTDSGAAAFKLLNRGGGAITKSPTINPTTSSSPYQYILPTNPDTGAAWTIAEINALQSGIEIA